MLKEADLVNCVLESLQAHIRSVVSLEELLDSISEEQISRDLIAGFKAQIADNEVQLEQVRQFKSTLYENFVSGIISKGDYLDLKNRYTTQIEQTQEAIKVEGKDKLKITFRYQVEFVKTLERLDQSGKLTPSLRVMLTTLVEMAKEAA